MPGRGERRRKRQPSDATPAQRYSVFGSREVLGAGILGAGVLAVIGGALLLSGGGDDGADDGSQATVTASAGASFSAANADEAAIEALARKSIEVLPRGKWPTLYDDFTAEFQARCPKEEFVQAGITAAQEQGANLTKLGFVRLDQVSIAGTTATAVITGEVQGVLEYQVNAAFQNVDGAWKLAPAADTQGCQAFNRP